MDDPVPENDIFGKHAGNSLYVNSRTQGEFALGVRRSRFFGILQRHIRILNGSGAFIDDPSRKIYVLRVRHDMERQQ
jgi:hypothetical protein